MSVCRPCRRGLGNTRWRMYGVAGTCMGKVLFSSDFSHAYGCGRGGAAARFGHLFRACGSAVHSGGTTPQARVAGSWPPPVEIAPACCLAPAKFRIAQPCPSLPPPRPGCAGRRCGIAVSARRWWRRWRWQWPLVAAGAVVVTATSVPRRRPRRPVRTRAPPNNGGGLPCTYAPAVAGQATGAQAAGYTGEGVKIGQLDQGRLDRR